MKKIKTMLSLTTLLVGASLLLLASCKGKPDAGTNTFDIEYIKVWEETVNKQNAVTVAAGKGKTVVVKVRNCNDFELDANGVLASAIEGKAETLSVNFEKGESLLTIVLKSKGFQDKTVRVAVTRKDKTKEFRVKMKRDANAVELNVSDKGKLQTSGTDAEVIVEADYVMTEVKIGSGTVTLASDGKKASATVPVGKVDVTVKFAEYEANPFSFDIEKVAPGQLPITCASSKLFIGDVIKEPVEKTLVFDAKNVATWSTDGEEGLLQYSLVKVEMDFDETISSVDIKCKDERSAKYAEQPTGKDTHGIFSGRVVKRMIVQGEGNQKRTVPVELKNVNDKKYTEYFIVGAGKVEYTLTFKANARLDSTYKIVLDNPIELDAEGKVTKGMTQLNINSSPKVNVWDYQGTNGLPANGGAFMALPCYHKGPVVTGQQWNLDNMQQLETMGHLKTIIERVGPTTSADEEGSIYFYANSYDDNDTNKREFVRYEPDFYDDSQGRRVEDITTRMDVGGKYFDGFVGFKNNLPQPICFLYVGNKVKELTKYGFLANVYAIAKGKDKQGNVKEGPTLTQTAVIQTYRQQAVYAGKVEADNGTAGNLTFAKNMTCKTWVLAEAVSTGGTGDKKVTVLSGKDILPVFICYNPPADAIPQKGQRWEWPKVTFTITKGTDGNNFSEACCGPTVAPVLHSGETGEDMLVFAGMPPLAEKEQPDSMKSYIFKEKDSDTAQPNVYKVEMKVKVSPSIAKEYTYTYILDYRAPSVNIELASADTGSSTSDLFGVPTAFDELPVMRARGFDFNNLSNVAF